MKVLAILLILSGFLGTLSSPVWAQEDPSTGVSKQVSGDELRDPTPEEMAEVYRASEEHKQKVAEIIFFVKTGDGKVNVERLSTLVEDTPIRKNWAMEFKDKEIKELEKDLSSMRRNGDYVLVLHHSLLKMSRSEEDNEALIRLMDPTFERVSLKNEFFSLYQKPLPVGFIYNGKEYKQNETLLFANDYVQKNIDAQTTAPQIYATGPIKQLREIVDILRIAVMK